MSLSTNTLPIAYVTHLRPFSYDNAITGCPLATKNGLIVLIQPWQTYAKLPERVIVGAVQEQDNTNIFTNDIWNDEGHIYMGLCYQAGSAYNLMEAPLGFLDGTPIYWDTLVTCKEIPGELYGSELVAREISLDKVSAIIRS